MPRALPTAIPAPLRPDAVFQALGFYVAGGVAAFGWAMCELLGWNARPWWPLWVSSALLVYNIDRLLPDPADSRNVPRRAALGLRLQGGIVALIAVSAAVLVGVPLFRGDWLTLVCVLAGAVVCLGYSVPFLGLRLKDVPLLKSFFAPGVVAAAVFVLPVLHGATFSTSQLALTVAWALCFLSFNMILCDLRDLAGDAVCGTRSLPVQMGESGARRVLGILLSCCALLALAAAKVAAGHAVAWAALAVVGTIYLAVLLRISRTRRSEAFYEWAVEGMLFLPLLAVLFGRLA